MSVRNVSFNNAKNVIEKVNKILFSLYHYDMGRGKQSTSAAMTSAPSRRSDTGSKIVYENFDKIRDVINERGESLLKPAYRAVNLGRQPRPYEGHCYAASEALYHLLGGTAQKDWKAMRITHEGGTHWWLRGPGNKDVDLTKEQFLTPVPYENGVGTGFLTAQPSKRAQVILDALKKK